MKRTFVIHPFLFAVYSILGIYSQNASQVPIDWTFRSLLILLALSIALYVLFLWIFRDAQRAGFLSTLVLMWLFMGHLYRVLLEWSPVWRTAVGAFIALVLISIPFGVLASGWVWKKITNKTMITNVLNIMSLVLVIFPIITILSILPRENAQIQTIRERQDQTELPVPTSDNARTDIYLIIVDGYGRADFLQNFYDYDNSEFIDFLKEKQFYVAEQSTSNYPQTELSLSSLLNFQYLDEYVDGFGDASGRGPLRELLQHTAVRSFLEDQGYKFVAMPSAALFAQMRDADMYIGLSAGDLNEFEALLLSSSLVGVVAETSGMELPLASYETHRRYVLFSLETLKEVPEIPGPKFVFAHILSPHPPFIFDSEGDFAPPDYPYSSWDASLFPGAKDQYITGYTDQMMFINQKLTGVINSILENSAVAPVIIIQGDHGPGAYYDMLQLNDSCLSERYSILNAYYFPDGDYQELYPEITPVNSFRVILNKYFGTNLDLIEDKNYFAGWLSPYSFTDVTSSVGLKCSPSAVKLP